MGIIERLVEMDKMIEDKYMETVSYNLQFEDTEIIFTYGIYIGFGDIVKPDTKIVFNACDVETNIEGMNKQIDTIIEWFNKNGTV